MDEYGVSHAAVVTYSHACLYIYMYRIQWKYIILFVYIHLKYLYMGHDVLA
jgi:hypothetical protein